MIPKIIHQTAPSDINEWHPIWKECQHSWIDNHKDFVYILWSDENIFDLIKNHYSEYLNFYKTLPLKIIQIDFARFCILHFCGGIYADMDIYCYKNFYSMLNDDLYLVESWMDWGEKVQNSLMVSSQGNEFWKKCMMNSKNLIEQRGICKGNDGVLQACGPKFLSNLITPNISILPKEIFNPKIKNQFNWARKNYESQEYKDALLDFNNLNQQNDIITRHYLTGTWSYAT